jgi:hypothetical protein
MSDFATCRSEASGRSKGVGHTALAEHAQVPGQLLLGYPGLLLSLRPLPLHALIARSSKLQRTHLRRHHAPFLSKEFSACVERIGFKWQITLQVLVFTTWHLIVEKLSSRLSKPCRGA